MCPCSPFTSLHSLPACCVLRQKERYIGDHVAVPCFTALFYRDCVLVSKTEVNHNTYLFRLQLPAGTVMHVPVGKHVCLKALVQGEQLHRQLVKRV